MPDETPLFWLISQQDRVKLMQYQWRKYGTKLDIPPRREPPKPEIPVRPEMTPEELGKFIAQPPEHQACPPELSGSGGREKVE